MISRKSASAYTKLPRLSRTLKRKPVFRDFNEDDIKYLWVAYKRGDVKFPKDLTPPQFDQLVIDTLDNQYEFGWAFLHDEKPVGFVFGSVSGPFVLLRDVTWLPTASPRNKMEHIVNLANVLRKSMKLIFTSTEKDKDFYTHVARHGITRRVGHINDLGETLALWESRCQVE